MDILSLARSVFSADRYATEVTGVGIEYVGDHEARCLLPIERHHCNARDVVMGGVLFTLADFSAAVAANTDCLTEGDLQWVSLDSTVHFLAPATGKRLVSSTSALKTGRSTALYQTIIENPDDGKRVAVVETTMVRIK